MDMENRQANRILNSRYPQDGPVKPWPWSAQVQILGAEDSGRHSLLNRLCQDTFTTSLNATNSGRRRIETRGQSCDIYFDIPVSLDEQKHIAQLDALVLVFDLSDPRSFQVLCAFCARCELAGVELGPCLIVGTKADLVEPRSQAVDDAWRLARRLGGSFVACSARDGSGIEALAEEVVQSVVEARKRLVRESEETLGEAVRRLMAQTPGRRPSLRRRLSARVGWRAEAEVEIRGLQAGRERGHTCRAVSARVPALRGPGLAGRDRLGAQVLTQSRRRPETELRTATERRRPGDKWGLADACPDG
ncbi:hypothetical protein AK830_g12368 [Neonectria ditissima]|uniref:Uncharacterized protein n=1 Tax=Neonectria ditissima TaxID=78410 RepID=A0A0P7B0K9_9HYPO|nr:hypothetical protein AK830_g12368 [Neonectria ditissima]